MMTRLWYHYSQLYHYTVIRQNSLIYKVTIQIHVTIQNKPHNSFLQYQLQCYFLFLFSQDPWWLAKPEYVGRWFNVIRYKILLSTHHISR
jgi:hypothetical protein